VEANHEMALIVVHCDKDKETAVKGRFENIINKIKAGISASNKLTNYFANIKFYIGAGGAVKEMVIGEYVSKALVENLHLDVTKEDLEELIEEFFIVRDINMRLPEPGQVTKSAVIFFNSQRDYYSFYDYFNDCEYCGFTLKVSPMRRSKMEFAWERMYIQFQWYIWQSHNKALVRFATEDCAKKAAQAFADNPTLDGSKVSLRLDGKNLYIDDLNDLTDEAFIDEAFKDFGNI
jgi:RNA recognition motif-containing protein